MSISVGQVRAARGLIGWSQEDLAREAKIGRATLADFESGKREPYSSTLEAIRSALELAGVIFVEENGEGPGVRLRKTQMRRLPDERQRSEAAKNYAREWTQYCKDHDSMAFASANGDMILVEYRRVDSLEVFNLLHVRVLEAGFEIDGRILNEDEMQKIVFDALNSKPRLLW